MRLVQGREDSTTVYDQDPVAAARRWAEQGAEWIHVVDLDAARTGLTENRPVVAAVAKAVKVPVQAGGGIRDEFSAEALLDQGVSRIVVGTAAVEQPGLVRRVAGRHPGRVAVAVDAREGELAVRGWTQASGVRLEEALGSFENAGVAAFVVTDISRDGTLTGPDVTGLAMVLAATEVPVIASGGVGSLADLQVLSRLEAGGRRLAGAVVGKALYEGAFSVADAIEALGRD